MPAVSRLDDWADAPRALRIVHDIPGRLRLRLPSGTSGAGLQDVVNGLDGALSSVWSPRTRSLLVRYDAAALTTAVIARAVAEHADLDPPAADDDVREAGRHPVASAVGAVFHRMNERVALRTRGRIDLPMLVSVGLVLWAGRQLLRGPVTALSWTSALWYAHGLFRDYQVTREP
jgi:hypothetical protein